MARNTQLLLDELQLVISEESIYQINVETVHDLANFNHPMARELEIVLAEAVSNDEVMKIGELLGFFSFFGLFHAKRT